MASGSGLSSIFGAYQTSAVRRGAFATRSSRPLQPGRHSIGRWQVGLLGRANVLVSGSSSWFVAGRASPSSVVVLDASLRRHGPRAFDHGLPRARVALWLPPAFWRLGIGFRQPLTLLGPCTDDVQQVCRRDIVEFGQLKQLHDGGISPPILELPQIPVSASAPGSVIERQPLRLTGFSKILSQKLQKVLRIHRSIGPPRRALLHHTVVYPFPLW
jgi:hypothetical protein